MDVGIEFICGCGYGEEFCFRVIFINICYGKYFWFVMMFSYSDDSVYKGFCFFIFL